MNLRPEYIEQAFTKFAKAVIKRARYNLTREGHKASGKLYKSLDNWEVKVSKAGSVTLVFAYEEYGDYQDKGVKGAANFKSHRMKEPTPYKYKNKMPPFKDLERWVKLKGIQFRDGKGRFQSHRSTAFRIQRSIFQKGIPQTLFFTKPFRQNFKKLPPDILKAFGDDLDSFLGGINR